MIKKIELSLDKLEPLVQLDDESVGKMLKAIYHYVLTQEVPDFGKGNQLLPFVFSIYKPILDAQIASADRRSAVNSENAKGKAASGNDKSSKSKSRRIRKETLSEEDISSPSEPIANLDAESDDSSQTASSASTATSFEQIESIYPKKASVGAYRDEALATWTNLDESERIASIAYVPTLSSMQNPPFLNQYLKTAPWRSSQAEDLK